jgi:hypothetical protein
MYNRYISGRRGDEEFVPASSVQQDFRQQAPIARAYDPGVTKESHPEDEKAVEVSSHRSILGGLFGRRSGKGLLDGLLGGFKDLDLGDIILILILILLILEGDDNDFLIALALVFFLGI